MAISLKCITENVTSTDFFFACISCLDIQIHSIAVERDSQNVQYTNSIQLNKSNRQNVLHIVMLFMDGSQRNSYKLAKEGGGTLNAGELPVNSKLKEQNTNYQS